VFLARENAVETPHKKVFKKLKSLKIEKKSEKYKIQHMTPGRTAE